MQRALTASQHLSLWPHGESQLEPCCISRAAGDEAVVALPGTGASGEGGSNRPAPGHPSPTSWFYPRTQQAIHDGSAALWGIPLGPGTLPARPPALLPTRLPSALLHPIGRDSLGRPTLRSASCGGVFRRLSRACCEPAGKSSLKLVFRSRCHTHLCGALQAYQNSSIAHNTLKLDTSLPTVKLLLHTLVEPPEASAVVDELDGRFKRPLCSSCAQISHGITDQTSKIHAAGRRKGMRVHWAADAMCALAPAITAPKLPVMLQFSGLVYHAYHV